METVSNHLVLTSHQPKEEEKTGLDPSKQDSAANGGSIIAQPPSEDDRDSRSVFVKNVHYTADAKEIEEHFADAGDIKLVTIMKNKMTHQPLGYCYIEFTTKQGAENAMAQDGSLFKGRLLTVN